MARTQADWRLFGTYRRSTRLIRSRTGWLETAQTQVPKHASGKTAIEELTEGQESPIGRDRKDL
jgi:hypothetical protein